MRLRRFWRNGWYVHVRPPMDETFICRTRDRRPKGTAEGCVIDSRTSLAPGSCPQNTECTVSNRGGEPSYYVYIFRHRASGCLKSSKCPSGINSQRQTAKVPKYSLTPCIPFYRMPTKSTR